MSIFKGAGVAIVTPMKNNEEVNYDRLEEMIEYQINQGTDCIIIAGTTVSFCVKNHVYCLLYSGK